MQMLQMIAPPLQTLSCAINPSYRTPKHIMHVSSFVEERAAKGEREREKKYISHSPCH